MALVTLLRLKMKVRGGGCATRVCVDSNSWFGFSYTDMIVEDLKVGTEKEKDMWLVNMIQTKINGFEFRFNGPKR